MDKQPSHRTRALEIIGSYGEPITCNEIATLLSVPQGTAASLLCSLWKQRIVKRRRAVTTTGMPHYEYVMATSTAPGFEQIIKSLKVAPKKTVTKRVDVAPQPVASLPLMVINITVGGSQLPLTLDDARVLHQQLSALFGVATSAH